MAMIMYNIRKRGPFEYDKTVLNVFQLANEIKRLKKKYESAEYELLENEAAEFKKMLESLIGESSIGQELLLLKEYRDYKKGGVIS